MNTWKLEIDDAEGLSVFESYYHGRKESVQARAGKEVKMAFRVFENITVRFWKVQ